MEMRIRMLQVVMRIRMLQVVPLVMVMTVLHFRHLHHAAAITSTSMQPRQLLLQLLPVLLVVLVDLRSNAVS